MKILELCLSPGLGGLELYAYRCSLALSTSNSVISVISPHGKLNERFNEHQELDVRFLKYHHSYFPLIKAYKLAKIIDQTNSDILHVHWGKDLVLAALAKSFSRKNPRLVYTRQMMITRMKSDFYHRFIYRRMDLMLTITKTLENLARGFIPEASDRITTLYYGVKAPDAFIDTDTITTQRKTLGIDRNDFVIGLFGRLEHGKGQHLLIEAVAMAKQDGLNIKALLVGHEMTPGYTESMKQLASDKGVLNNIIFSGFIPDPQSLMQTCDCVALTSYEETFGLVLPEAMRAGVAVIGSKAGGVPEIIEHEKTGLLFTAGDTGSLYEQLARLYNQPEFKQTLAVQGKLRADRDFNETQHFSQLETHFSHLLQTANTSL